MDHHHIEKMSTKKKFDALGAIVCETQKGLHECKILDFVHDLANMVMYFELNHTIMEKRLERTERQLIMVLNKTGLSEEWERIKSEIEQREKERGDKT